VHDGLALRFVQPLEKLSLAGDGVHRRDVIIRSPGLSILLSPSRKGWGTVDWLGVEPSGGNV
jgi:hypothetical protein